MRFYVASGYDNKQAVGEAIARLTALGHEVTHDWTWDRPWDWSDRAGVEGRAPMVAFMDIVAVLEAEAFILLTYYDAPMIGAYVELGAALVRGQLVYIVGDQPKNTFQWHPNVTRADSLDEVIKDMGSVSV